MSVNKCFLIGRLGQDVDMKYLPDGTAVANISLATSEKFKDKQTGQMTERVEWHRISFFGKLAEIVGQYLKKGSQVYVEGSIQTKKWTDKEGIERYSTGIKGRSLQMLDAKSDGQQQPQQQRQQQQTQPVDGNTGYQQQGRPQPYQQQAQYQTQPVDDFDDSIPF